MNTNMQSQRSCENQFDEKIIQKKRNYQNKTKNS